MTLDAKSTIEAGKAILGIEFGSTRIKAVLIDQDNKPIAQGSHTWENQLVDGLWTYSVEAIWYGLQDCYADLRANVLKEYDTEIETLAAIGISAMMHGYMAFNKDEEILVPFRTWRNTNTGKAAAELSKLFVYNIPLRWSISHLYEAILDNEEHVGDIDFLTTLAGYVHWQITGERVLGIGDASGMLPIDPETKDYNAVMVEKFDKLVAPKGYSWKLLDILPKVLLAGENAGFLTPEGAKKLDVSGHLKAGIPVCPPEGDAGTGMVATNAVRQRTGNVSAGTSSFSMIVLEKDLSKPYEMIDMVTTPDGSLVAMVHCNNCTSDLNAWVNLFQEALKLMGHEVDMNKLYGKLYNHALTGNGDCGGLMAYNYVSGERDGPGGWQTHVRALRERQVHVGQLHACPSLWLSGRAQGGQRHTLQRGARKGRPHHGSWRLVQDQGRRPANTGGSHQLPPFLSWRPRARVAHGASPCWALTWSTTTKNCRWPSSWTSAYSQATRAWR